MFRFLILAIVFSLPADAFGQTDRDGTPNPPAQTQTTDDPFYEFDGELDALARVSELPQEVAGDTFRRSVIRAAVNARRAGNISRGDLIKIRVAMFTPAVRDQVENMAVWQMDASATEVPAELQNAFEVDDQGKILRTSINWDQLISFLERLLPLILQFISALGVVVSGWFLRWFVRVPSSEQ